MAEIKMARVDFRLIHGQVITKWIKYYPTQMIVIVDDILASDDFMQEIYEMAVPKGVKFKVVSIAQAKGFLDDLKKTVFLIFKDIQTCKKTIDSGVTFELLVIGGVPGEHNRKLISDGIWLNEEDYRNLQAIEKTVSKISIKSIPEDKTIEFKDVKI